MATASNVTLAFIFDNESFKWGELIVNYTMQMLNAKDDGWYDDLLTDGTVVHWTYRNDNCVDVDAGNAYGDIRRELGGVPPHGIVGARCSDATLAVALVAGADGGVTQVSPTASSAKLSDKDKYPNFLRLSAPDDASGQVGALKALLEKFGWERLSIIFTGSQYSRDFVSSFKEEWPDDGIVATSEVKLKGAVGESRSVDKASAQKALNSVEAKTPGEKSRIVLLVADGVHAYDILRLAHARGFQKDTIWIGTDAWMGADRVPKSGFDTTNYRQGYLGLQPSMNRNRESEEYKDYLKVLNSYLARDGLPTYEELPDYAAETMVDSIVTFAKAFSNLAPADRRNSSLVTAAAYNLTFNGVNGPVAFTDKGDRANSNYTVFNAKATAKGQLEWVDVGYIGMKDSSIGQSDVQLSNICFVEPFGCNWTNAPVDWYYVPPVPLPLWVWIVVPIIAVLFILVLFRYIRSKRKKNQLRQSFQAFQDRILGIDDTIEQGVKERQRLIGERYSKPDNWKDAPGPTSVLVDVTPYETEYWDVQARLQREMPDAQISKLWRVQNHSLWAFYTFHKDRFTMNGIGNHNEIEVWHGTTNLDPDTIYRDRQDGFMMQFARMGFWGRGLYFAEHSSYSDMYSYKPTGPSWQPTFSDRPQGEADEREMFLTKLLVGNAVTVAQNNSLIVPPLDPANPGQRYNTVTGKTGGSPVYVVYENGRAYPSYLVRYYKGTHDRNRTPYASFVEAKDAQNRGTTSTASSSDEDPGLDVPAGDGGVANPVRAVWEFCDNQGWSPYGDAHQSDLEAAYARGNPTCALDTADWSYEVSFQTMDQVNLTHPANTRRKVRRLEVPVSAGGGGGAQGPRSSFTL